jgi:primosomal protein N' (replication factor Y)
MMGHFSDVLMETINTALSLEQSDFISKPKGYSPIIECITCGRATMPAMM